MSDHAITFAGTTAAVIYFGRPLAMYVDSRDLVVGRESLHTICCIKTETNFEQNYLRFRKSSERENHSAQTFLIIAICNHVVDAVGQVWKICPRFMTRGREIALFRQLSPWKSSATQTQFGIF